MASTDHQFQIWDYLVFSAVLLLSIIVGLIFAFTGGKQRTNKEFLMANRQMAVTPVAISMVVTIISAITLVGTPGEMYVYNSELWLLALGASLGYILSAVFFVPLLFPLKLTSAYEYLELRFNSKAAKLTGTLITLTNAVLYMGIVMYAPATALEQVTGAPIWVTVILLFVVSTIYTALGGLKAVLWVDTLQSIIMVVGMLAVIVQGAIKVGGLERVFEICNKHKRIEFLDFNPNPLTRHTFWTIVLGGMIEITARTGVYQAAVQRYCAVPTLNKARIATLMNIPFLIIFSSLACLSGLTMFAYYADKGCDPLKAKIVKNPNQLITYFLADVLGYPGLPGLFVGSVFSAVLSTTSSIQSATAAITYEDIIKPYVTKLPENRKTWITKSLVVVYGGFGTGLAFIMQNLRGTVIQVSIAFVGASVGPLLGLFILASVFPWANWIGAVVGGLVGLSFPLFLSIGAWVYWPPTDYLPSPGIHNCTNLVAQANGTATSMVTALFTTTASSVNTTAETSMESWTNLFTMSYQYNGCIGMATVVIVGLLVSFITCPTKKSEVDPKYLMPFFDRFFCGCLPKSLTRKLQCYTDFQSVEYEKGETESHDNLEFDDLEDTKM